MLPKRVGVIVVVVDDVVAIRVMYKWRVDSSLISLHVRNASMADTRNQRTQAQTTTQVVVCVCMTRGWNISTFSFLSSWDCRASNYMQIKPFFIDLFNTNHELISHYFYMKERSKLMGNLSSWTINFHFSRVYICENFIHFQFKPGRSNG